MPCKQIGVTDGEPFFNVYLGGGLRGGGGVVGPDIACKVATYLEGPMFATLKDNLKNREGISRSIWTSNTLGKSSGCRWGPKEVSAYECKASTLPHLPYPNTPD